ncbi:regulator of complement activation group 2 gene 1 isoform X2 [Salminus brasiliensis]|uniref:regulator of complement activation group 2 gene 1 isoform X2 n=1 Tax=Salminus brasiliensis TaxID=930266 RepID=UPI003B830295
MSKPEFRSGSIFLLCLLQIVHIRAQCEKPNLGANRMLTADSDKPSYPDGSTATFTCSVGYLPEDSKASKTIVCSGSTWTELALRCKKRSCGPLPDISSGRYSYSPDGADGVLFGATATAQCNKGYMIFGKDKRYCRETGWDGRDPVCEEVKCSSPPDVENGKLTEPAEEHYGYQSVVTYTCNEGYFVSGQLSISCLENGTFSTPPQCKKVLCGDLEIDPNSERTGARPPYKLKSFIEFKCRSGYTLQGSNYLRCEPSGWDHPPPRCIAPTTTTTTTTTTAQSPKATTPRTPTRPTRPTPEEREVGPTPTPPSSNGNGLKVGLGIGISLLIVLVGGGLFYCYKNKASMDHTLSHPKP